jgi:hypothetical protein
MTVTSASSLARLVAERESVLTAFLEREQDRLARACHDMARAFSQGGVLIPFGAEGDGQQPALGRGR